MSAPDRRVRRTQHLLARALIEMTLEKGYDAVTIRDITEKADVGYATFFRHYRDKDALLHDVTDVVVSDLTSLLHDVRDGRTMGVRLFEHVRENIEICRLLLLSWAHGDLVRHVMEKSTGDEYATYADGAGPIPTELGLYLFISSSLALVEWWIYQDLPPPPEKMGEIFAELATRWSRLSD